MTRNYLGSKTFKDYLSSTLKTVSNFFLRFFIIFLFICRYVLLQLPWITIDEKKLFSGLLCQAVLLLGI